MQWLIDIILELVPGVPRGTICAWYGLRGEIPDGWAPCDGNNGTPDLRDRFVRNAGPTVAKDETGGTVDHTHTPESNHNHTLADGIGIGAGKAKYISTGPPENLGNIGTSGTLPPYYALWWMMKL